MKRFLAIALFSLLIVGCSSEDDSNNNTSATGCDGDTCAATVGTGETAATIPASAAGVYETEYTFEEPNSPFTLGTMATFEVTDDEKLVVDVDGFDCITLSNPIWRFGADGSSGNYTFKDECRDMIAYNVSFTTDGNFNEVNIEPVDGPGFFGQFGEL